MFSKLWSLESQNSTQACQGQMWEQDTTLTLLRIALTSHTWISRSKLKQSLPTVGFWLHQFPWHGCLSYHISAQFICIKENGHSTNKFVGTKTTILQLSPPDSWKLSHSSATGQHLWHVFIIQPLGAKIYSYFSKITSPKWSFKFKILH